MKKASNIPTWNYPSLGTPIYRDTTDVPSNIFRQGGFMTTPPEIPPKDYSNVPGVNKEKLEQWNSLGKQEPSNVQEAQLLAEAVGYTPYQAIIVAAQWALESGRGKKVGGDYNYFGIKAHNEAVKKRMADMYGLNLSANELVPTSEYESGVKKPKEASFMNFDNPIEAFLGHKAFLETNARYKKALTEATSPAEFAQALQKAGYATSPTYSEALGKIAIPIIGKEAYGTATSTATTTPLAPTRPKTFDSVLYSGEVAQANAGINEYHNTMAGFNRPFQEVIDVELPKKKNLPAMSLKPGSANFGQSIFTAGQTFNPPKTNSKKYGGTIGEDPPSSINPNSLFHQISSEVDINPKWNNEYFHYRPNEKKVYKTLNDRFKNFQQDLGFKKHKDVREIGKYTTVFKEGGTMGDPPPKKLFNFDPTPEYVGYQGDVPVSESTRVANTYRPTEQEIKATKEYTQKVGATAQAIRELTGVSHEEAMRQANRVPQVQAEAKAYANTKQAQERDAYVFGEGMNARDYFKYPLQFLSGNVPTQEERIQDRIRITDPRTSGLDKFMGTVGEAASLAPEALLNTGIGLAFAPANLSRLGMVADAVSPIGLPTNPKYIGKAASSVDDVGKLGNYQKILDKGLDIHDVRLKYHNNMILDFDEHSMINKFGKGNKSNYERALVEDIAGKMHTDDVAPTTGKNLSRKKILEHFSGTEQAKVTIPNKNITPIENNSNIDFISQEQNIIKPKKFEVPSFYSAPYDRTSTSRAADKWLEDWFTNPETKQKFIEYGGTEKEWEGVLNSLENPIKSKYKWGKNQPGGVYMKPFDQASIPLDASVDIGVHEGIHKAKLLLGKENPILHRLWNDLTDAVKLTPAEAYPEIFRFRQKLGLKPGQTIDLKTMEDNLHLISDGYSMNYKIKDKNKLLEIINKAPALLPAAIVTGAAAAASSNEYKLGGLLGDPPPKNSFLPTSSSFDPAALNRIYQDVKEQEKIQNLPEQQIYATPESRKKYEDVYAKAQSVVKTFPRVAEHFTKNKRYKDQGIEGVSEYIQDITNYQKDAEKYYKARQAVKKGRMSTEDFERAYRERGWQQFDSKNVKTSEEDQKELEEIWYGPTDEQGRRYWMRNPMNVAKLAHGVATAAVLGPAASITGVAAPIAWYGRGALKVLANPWVSTPLTGYGIYDAAANTIPDAVKAFNEDRIWDGIGNTALATADLALPFIPWGKVVPKLLPGATSEFAGDIAKIKKDITSAAELTKNVTSFPGSTFDIIRGLRNFPEYKKLNKKLNIAESEFATKSKEIDDEVKLKLIPERENLKKELNDIAVRYETKTLEGKELIKLEQKEKELTNKINSIDELIQAKEKGLIKVVDNYNLKIEKELSIFKETGSMKTELSDGKNYITDFETGEQVPFNINIPKAETNLGVQPRTTVNEEFYPFATSGDKVITKKTEALEGNYSMGEAAKNTMIKNIEYVKQRFPGSVEFGSSTFAKLGIPHATDDIDLITTRKAFNEIEKLGYKQTGGTQARYGKTYDLEGKTKIDVNVIEEGKDGMATGELASELYRLYYPDEFYSEMSRLVIKSAKTNKTPNISEVKIHVSPEELLAKVQENPAIKTLVDAFEAGASNPTKAKHLNRTDYILETAQDTETVKKAQEAWIKSVAGSKGNIGFQFPKEQLVDVSSAVSAFNSVKRNKEILSKINITKDLGYNVSNIASNPDRMQLFLNDYYMNSALFSRNIELDTFKEVLKKEGVKVNLENLQDAFITWKKGKTGSASAMGYGINFLEYGNPSFGSVSGDVFYNLIHNKNYSNPLEYIDDIERQVKASYVFNEPEKNIIKELADKYSIEIKGDLNTLSKWNLIDKSTVPKGNFIEGITENQTKEYDKLTSFYKEVGETLGMKAVTRVDKNASFGNSFYSSGLGNIDKELDAINISLKKLESDKFGHFNPIPFQKSRRSRQENLERTNRGDRSTEIENRVLYNLKNIDLKIGAINSYNESARNLLLNKKSIILTEIDENKKILQKKVFKFSRSKEIRGENPNYFLYLPPSTREDKLRIPGNEYNSYFGKYVHTQGSTRGNIYLGNDEKRYLYGELGKIDKQIGDFELEIEKYANKIKEVKELQAPIERFFSDDAINSFAWLSVSTALGLGTTMGLINEFSSNEPSGNRKIKSPTDEEFHNENETNLIWMPTKETPYGYNEGEWRKQKTKKSFVQLPNGTWVKRTFTDVGKTEVRKLGGKLNTLTKSQNTLPLQSITEAQEVKLTPEEAKYYESLGYNVEELD